MEVDALYYNPETHRIRAQRSLDAKRDALIEGSPWSQESQDYLHQLLVGSPSDPKRLDPEFSNLKDDLRENGQRDPGVITPTGILVNGNTRRAALKELGNSYIRVGVLPDDWGWHDVQSVELALQLRKEFRRDYSFINRLLAVEEQVAAGRPKSEVAREFRVKVPTIERDVWLLQFIHDAITRSERVHPDGTKTSLRLVDFERDQGQLEELARAFFSREATDPLEAERLREARLLAVALDFAKTDIRLVEPDFYTRYLKKGLPVAFAPSPSRKPEARIPGIETPLPPEPDDLTALRTLVDQVLQDEGEVRSGASDPESERVARRQELRKHVEESIDAAGRDIRLRKKKLAAPDRITAAADALELSLADLVNAKSTGQVDTAALDEALQGLRLQVRALADQLRRVDRHPPGEGIAWLVSAADAEIAESDAAQA